MSRNLDAEHASVKPRRRREQRAFDAMRPVQPPSLTADIADLIIALTRRYTNVYVRVDGAWRWLARHADVVLAK